MNHICNLQIQIDIGTEPEELTASEIELCQQLHWLPVRQRINYKLAVVTYKTGTTSTPTYLSHVIHDYNPGCCLRSADKLILTVLRTWKQCDIIKQANNDGHWSTDLDLSQQHEQLRGF